MNYFDRIMKRINDNNSEIIIQEFGSSYRYGLNDLHIQKYDDYHYMNLKTTYTITYKGIAVPLSEAECNKIGELISQLYMEQRVNKELVILAEL